MVYLVYEKIGKYKRSFRDIGRVHLDVASVEQGRIVPEKTDGGHRRYDISKLASEMTHRLNIDTRKTIAYAIVSTHDQKQDLERQKHRFWNSSAQRMAGHLNR